MDNEKKHNRDQVLHILSNLQFKFRRKRSQQRRPRECREAEGKPREGDVRNQELGPDPRLPSPQANATFQLNTNDSRNGIHGGKKRVPSGRNHLKVDVCTNQDERI